MAGKMEQPHKNLLGASSAKNEKYIYANILILYQEMKKNGNLEKMSS